MVTVDEDNGDYGVDDENRCYHHCTGGLGQKKLSDDDVLMA
jgi:hypothetical protein